MSRSRILPYLPSPGDCEVCGQPMRWFTVVGSSSLLPGADSPQQVSLCIAEECENGVPKTAERMGWET